MAVNFFDRFLCACPIDRYHLQLLGCCALLLASKIRQCHPLTVDVLSAYTDHAVSPDQIRVSAIFCSIRADKIGEKGVELKMSH